jgi:ketosteroid isomerase-like protein
MECSSTIRWVRLTVVAPSPTWSATTARRFPTCTRELFHIYVDGNVVVVQLALQGTHDGALQLPFGELPATGKRMDAPCCDVFELEDGKIKRFDCYPEGSIIFAQLGVLNNLDAALSH